MGYIILALSVGLNILLCWYGYKLIKKSLSYAENIYFLLDDLESFTAHLEAVYELQTFYGDETLLHLLEHSRQLKDDVGEFKQNSILEIEEEELEEEANEYKESEEEARP